MLERSDVVRDDVEQLDRIQELRKWSAFLRETRAVTPSLQKLTYVVEHEWFELPSDLRDEMRGQAEWLRRDILEGTNRAMPTWLDRLWAVFLGDADCEKILMTFAYAAGAYTTAVIAAIEEEQRRARHVVALYNAAPDTLSATASDAYVTLTTDQLRERRW